jgi:hypothetical protein
VAIAVRLAGGGCGDFEWWLAGDADPFGFGFGDAEWEGGLVTLALGVGGCDLGGVTKVGEVGAVAPATAVDEVPPGGRPLIQINNATTMITTPTAASGASS